MENDPIVKQENSQKEYELGQRNSNCMQFDVHHVTSAELEEFSIPRFEHSLD